MAMSTRRLHSVLQELQHPCALITLLILIPDKFYVNNFRQQIIAAHAHSRITFDIVKALLIEH
jgi:hypothetical protein